LSKVKVRVIGAYVDGYAPGNDIELDEKSAAHLEKIGYVKRVEAKKQEPKKQVAEPESKSKPKKSKQKKQAKKSDEK
jgi:hypothetical protein